MNIESLQVTAPLRGRSLLRTTAKRLGAIACLYISLAAIGAAGTVVVLLCQQYLGSASYQGSFTTEKILTALFVFAKSVIGVTGYSGIALLMAIESACIPLPSELIMPFAGYLVYQGTFRLLWVATAGAIGCNLGSLVAYEIGFYGGRPLVERYGQWILMSRRELDWADRFFARWGYLAVFIARLLPVIRTFIALPAGVARMPRGRFHAYTFLGSWPWCFALAWFGMRLGENWRALGKYFHQFDAVIGVVLVIGLVWFVWNHWQNRVRLTD